MASQSHVNMGYFPTMPSMYSSSGVTLGDEQNHMQHKSSPLSTASTVSSGGSQNDSPGGWSPNTECSEFSSSPPSDDGFVVGHCGNGTEDWDLLSEMLIDDALNGTQQTFVASGQSPATVSGTYASYGAPPTKLMYQQQQQQHQQHQQQHQRQIQQQRQLQQQHQQQQRQLQQHHQHQQHLQRQHQQLLQQHQQQHQHQHQQQQQQNHAHMMRRAVAVPSPAPTMGGFVEELLMQDDGVDALAPPQCKANALGSPQTTDLFPSVHMPTLVSEGLSDSDTSPLTSPQASKVKGRKAVGKKTRSPPVTPTDSAAAPDVKQESLTADELKKLRRRSQIASSVQRHREKKKTLVAALKQDLSTLTSHLAQLRSQRKVLHAHNERLIEWEEEAITQRRKRKQSEELNQRMKKALFQQTSFLMGMRSIMTNIPAPREMQIHDWLHSYTVLSARDLGARRKEYLTYFSDSKIDMAHQIVMRETNAFASRLTLSSPYFAEIRILHDGTDEVFDEDDVVLKKELREEAEYAVPGTGQVMKKYSTMFLFEERGNCTLDAFRHVAMEATKSVGVFWPSPGYESQASDAVQAEDGSQLFFTDLHGSMSLIDDQLTDADQDVTLEARMLCRVKNTTDESLIVWDYVDKDDLYPIEGERSIRRDSCGAVIVRREPGGQISFRSICVKSFSPIDTVAIVDDDTKALMQRRINLQASEIERANQKCVRSIYESLSGAFVRPVTLPSA